MKNVIKNVTFHTSHGNWIVLLKYKSLTTKQVKVNQLFNQSEYGCLFECPKNYRGVEFILKDSKSCWLLSFNSNGNLVWSEKFDAKNKMPLKYVFTARFVVVLPLETIIPIKESQSITIKENIPEPPIEPQIVILNLEKDKNLLKNKFKETFPFIIIRRMAAIYEKIFIQYHFDLKPDLDVIYINPNQLPEGKSLSAILQSGELDESLKKLAKENAIERRATKFCLVLEKNRCFYYENGKFHEHNELPYGGTLIIGHKMIEIKDMGKHY